MVKVIILVMLASILLSLFMGAFFLIKDGGGGMGVVKSLTWRVGLQGLLFAFLVLAYTQGWILPHFSA